MELHPKVVRNLKAGIYVTNVPGHWQPGLRQAIDAAMEQMRRDLRSTRNGK